MKNLKNINFFRNRTLRKLDKKIHRIIQHCNSIEYEMTNDNKNMSINEIFLLMDIILIFIQMEKNMLVNLKTIKKVDMVHLQVSVEISM